MTGLAAVPLISNRGWLSQSGPLTRFSSKAICPLYAGLGVDVPQIQSVCGPSKLPFPATRSTHVADLTDFHGRNPKRRPCPKDRLGANTTVLAPWIIPFDSPSSLRTPVSS
jgi:hypothetical protein